MTPVLTSIEELEQQLRPRVAAGVRVLDAAYQRRWRREIAVGGLDMSRGWHAPAAGDCGCVAAQIHRWLSPGADEGGFRQGVSLSGIPAADREAIAAWATAHGMYLPDCDEFTDDLYDAAYPVLTRLWREALDWPVAA
jgi:hypothetical protein